MLRCIEHDRTLRCLLRRDPTGPFEILVAARAKRVTPGAPIVDGMAPLTFPSEEHHRHNTNTAEGYAVPQSYSSRLWQLMLRTSARRLCGNELQDLLARPRR